MKTSNKFIIKVCLLILAASFSTISCKDYLDKSPAKGSNVEITTTAQLDAVLENYPLLYLEPNKAAIFANDDFGYLTGLYDASNTIYSQSLANLFIGCWDYDKAAGETMDNMWTGEWGKIFKANLVLNYVDKVSGSTENKIRLKAEASFMRAYSYWVLANTYCLPYTQANKGEMGLPIKRSTSFDESLSRATLEETYNFMEQDMREALKCTTPLLQNGKAKHWRANTAGINGFLARFYLNQNNYTQALKYAGDALNEYSTLVNYNTEMRLGFPSTVTVNPGTPEAYPVTVQYPYTHDENPGGRSGTNTDHIGWKEHLYMRFLDNDWNYYIPSPELITLYDHDHDLRFKYHMVQHFSFTKGAAGGTVGGATKPVYDYPGYVFFYENHIPNGPATAEMYLIKAECQARLNDYNSAMQTLNILRASRMEPGSWVDLSAANKEDAIKKILEERRRELPFTQRWYDLRRFNNNEDPSDDVVVTRTFYRFDGTAIYGNEAPVTYTLEKKSRKYALPILNSEINASGGKLKQNTY